MAARNYLSLSVWLLMCYVIVRVALLYPRWQKPMGEATLSWDVYGYYLYLPAIFIYDDLTELKFAQALFDQYQPASNYHASTEAENGKQVMKYPIGVAVLYSPFFLLAHGFASMSDYAADGFSTPYQFAFSFGAMLYAFLGLWLIRIFLLRYFKDVIVAILLAVLVLGTNYLNYTAFDGSMPHNVLFTLYAGILLLTERYHLRPNGKVALSLGVLIGLATIVRPIELMTVLIPLLWGITNRETLLEKWHLLRSHWQHVGLLVLGMFAMGMLQMTYWKISGGHWLVYSYGDFGFDWFKPHLLEGLFGFRKGWLVYTPVMALAVIGLIPLFGQYRNRFWLVLLYLLLTIYIVFSWEVWWYGGSFGARPMVQSYTLLCLPLGTLLTYVWERKVLLVTAAVFMVLCADMNLFMTWQAHAKGTQWEAEYMTRAYFWRIFGNPNPTREDYKFLDVRGELTDLDDWEVIPLYRNDFEADTSGSLSDQHLKSGRQAWLLNTETAFTPAYSITLGELNAPSGSWIRVRGWFLFEQMEWDVWRQTQLVTLFMRDGKSYKETTGRIQRLADPNHGYQYQYEMVIPSRAEPTDELRVHVWNPGSRYPVWVDDLEVDLLQPKD